MDPPAGVSLIREISESGKFRPGSPSHISRRACLWCELEPFANDEHLLDHITQDHASQLKGLDVKPGTPLFKKWVLEEGLLKAKSYPVRHGVPGPKASPSPPEDSPTRLTPELQRLGLEAQSKRSPTDKGEPPPSLRTKKRPAGSDILSAEAPARRGRRTDINPRRAKVAGPTLERRGADIPAVWSPEPSGDQPCGPSGDHAPFVVNQKPLFKSVGTPGNVAYGPPKASALPPHGDLSKYPQPGTFHASSPGPDSQLSHPSGVLDGPTDARYPGLVMQPDSRPISQEQLAAEVKSIYAGLTMVETKCIHVDKSQAAANQAGPGQQPRLPRDHWAALIALHRTLLHEHHDFFLASQHPSASPALRRLAAKYSMPARMWKHGIHSFLEILRARLPESLDYMLSFIYIAYQMVALLYETVRTFEDTWVECLGDLARYRMAVEDEDIRDREIWAGVARFWYNKAADRSPAVGRLYHHLAILARPYALQQLHYYSRSLACLEPFMGTKESILTLFGTLNGRTHTPHTSSVNLDTVFVKAHSVLFGRVSLDFFTPVLDEFINQLDNHIGRVTAKYKEQGIYMAVSNIAALFLYGSKESALRAHFDDTYRLPEREPAALEQSMSMSMYNSKADCDTAAPIDLPDPFVDPTFPLACKLIFSTFRLVLLRVGDKNVLPHVHVLFVFVFALSTLRYDSTNLMGYVPWEETVLFLNTLARSEKITSQVEEDTFPGLKSGDNRPLPEDYQMRGQVWCQGYHPDGWFSNHDLDEEERSLELASTVESRTQRVLWMGRRIAIKCEYIEYDATTKSWAVNSSSFASRQVHSPQISVVESSAAVDVEMDVDQSENNHSIEQKRTEQRNPASYARQAEQPQPRHNTHNISDQPPLTPVSRARSNASNSPNGMQVLQSFTTIVCDTNMLLNQHDIFCKMVNEGNWDVVIPDNVIDDLFIIYNSHDKDHFAAKRALDTIDKAIAEHRNIRVLTAMNEDVTARLAAREHLNTKVGSGRASLEDVVVGVARQQSDLKKEAAGTLHGFKGGVEVLVLVTDMDSMSLKAEASGVRALASSKFRSILGIGRTRSRAASRAESTNS